MRRAPLVRGTLLCLGSIVLCPLTLAHTALGRRKLAQAPEESLDWSALQSFRI